MHDIWNPWHGCVKKSEGCLNCYMFYQDEQRNKDGGRVYKVLQNFDYPLQRDKNGKYKVKSGEIIRVCMTSDFFLSEADAWRPQAWEIMRQRSDVAFMLLTKRPERVAACLPPDWKDGWENIFFNVTAENQKAADERVPLLLSLPFKHKGIVAAPFIGEISLKNWLSSGQIEQVVAGGENYGGARPLSYEWVKKLYEECKAYGVSFCFMETGTNFIKDGKTYHIPDKRVQSRQAFLSGLQYLGKGVSFRLKPAQEQDLFGEEKEIYQKFFREICDECASRMICNGCSDCGRCKTAEKQAEKATRKTVPAGKYGKIGI